MISIAIDGPAGAGKSTVAKALAQELGYVYLDTGALYRTVGLAAVRHGIAPTEQAAVVDMLPHLSISLDYDETGMQHVYLNGEDVTAAIRLPEMSMAASAVSAMPEVRSFLLQVQRNTAAQHNVIMDGRDIGTVILPHATLKIFLTADAEERAKRRMGDLAAAGHMVDFDALLAEIQQRDHNDSTRATAPLKAAPDAILLDSTALTFQQTLQQVKVHLQKCLQREEQ